MAPLKTSSVHPQDGQFGTCQSNKHQDHKIAGFLQRDNRVHLGFVGPVCLPLKVRKHGLEGKGHVLIHNQSHEQLNTILGELLPAFVVVS